MKQVLDYLCEVKNGMKDSNLFMKCLFKIETPYMTQASLEYLKTMNELKFMFENRDSESWTVSSEDVDLNIMIFKHNLLTDCDNKILLKALASTDQSDLFIFDDIRGIDGVNKRQEWALRGYAKYLDIENERRELASESKLDDFPISPQTLECLVLYFGQFYAVNTISNMISNIHSAQQDTCNKKFTKEHWEKFQQSLETVKIHRVLDCEENNRRLEGIGKCPMFYPVHFWILDKVPKTEQQRDFYNSLFLFMIYTGQRYVTICNIRLSDISAFRKSSRDDKMIVTIIARVTKGNNAFNQPYSIEGSIVSKLEGDEIMNFIYWLNETLKIYHNLDLQNFDKWPKNKLENKYLWGNPNSNYTKFAHIN